TVLPGLAVDRSDVDDAPVAAAGHSFPNGLGHVEAAAEVRIHDLLPLLVVHALHRRVAGDAGIVDQHVDRSDFFLDLLHARLTGFVVGDVPFERRNAGAFRELASALVIACVIRRDLHALVAQRDADRFADSTGTA